MIQAISSIVIGSAMTIGVIAMAAYCTAVEPNNVTLDYLMIAQVCLVGSLGSLIASSGWKDFKAAWVIRKAKPHEISR